MLAGTQGQWEAANEVIQFFITHARSRARSDPSKAWIASEGSEVEGLAPSHLSRAMFISYDRKILCFDSDVCVGKCGSWVYPAKPCTPEQLTTSS
ncbi:hypothetical protein HBI56_189500 [Parastagonospora nodorum]|uniref:Uncharacterized protein n=1 Tax=Phaeosphaeria nodorum (strain SN15 / ATCC MYA-4574 / FGSC 10173) TaxID=321614 RepID=A0A7U2F9T8_PHANO|nr:hypothetical protein HBH56_144960 [Parastagonospora nodorum]QRD01366.1 hypothetical protein JI435_416520 [Parastagonospora nodorum SN15]KAH3927687.1 hypothetical protein HBH54_150150 [Parastagonospora nodorum]KAH3948021.1 hypothetical protein HBH53_110190 [Parastagonospora nodorum]KAH3960171.1 hypothetical protein HBH51_194010 [Parastagonospora nodorum]